MLTPEQLQDLRQGLAEAFLEVETTDNLGAAGYLADVALDTIKSRGYTLAAEKESK